MSEIRPRGRAGIACLPCRKQKIRCNGKQPCERCKRMSLQCLFGSTPSTPTSPYRRTLAGSSSIRTPRINRIEESRPPTPDELPRYGSSSTRSTKSTVSRRQRSVSDSTVVLADQLSPPFSTFTYQPAPDPPIRDFLVPLCAQPFPELQDPVECGIVPLSFANWLFD